MIIAICGIVLGIAAALIFGKIIQSLLFDIEPTDPATLLFVSVIMLVTTAVASYIPARRVTWVDPIVVLRDE